MENVCLFFIFSLQKRPMTVSHQKILSKGTELNEKKISTSWAFGDLNWPDFLLISFRFAFYIKLIQTKSFPLFFHSGYKWFARRNCRNLWKFIWKSRMNSNFIQTLWYYKSSKHWKRNFQTMFVILYKPDGSALE